MSTECRTITVIGIHCIRAVLVDWGFKRSKAVSVGEGEKEGCIGFYVTSRT
jgi:hypothetical protein